ncbi:MAG: toxic anion resistance protein [Gammaproteobacteria bacterium]|nr:toxic anion resistance protein [Gammaproteobacteria bacterium]
MAAKAEAYARQLYAIDAEDLETRQRHAESVYAVGMQVQSEMAHKSAMLRRPMQQLMNDAEDGGPVANSLLKLQEEVSGINPNEMDFDMGGFRKLLSKIPGFGTPVSRWVARYQSVEGVIQDVIDSLRSGKSQLERDNVTLLEDQREMRRLTRKLGGYADFGQLVDQRLEKRLTDEPDMDPERRSFLQEEIQFPLRQRVLDIQQQLAVNQQGVLTTEVIVRNNRELVRGVTRALNVTVPALNTAATLALALQTQKRVLDGVEKVSNTTEDLIGQTAKRLKNQGVHIQRQAAGSMLDIDKLKAAFADIDAALKDLSSFRQKALPQMAQSIVQMDSLTRGMEESIVKLEKGSASGEPMEINLDSL